MPSRHGANVDDVVESIRLFRERCFRAIEAKYLTCEIQETTIYETVEINSFSYARIIVLEKAANEYPDFRQYF